MGRGARPECKCIRRLTLSVGMLLGLILGTVNILAEVRSNPNWWKPLDTKAPSQLQLFTRMTAPRPHSHTEHTEMRLHSQVTSLWGGGHRARTRLSQEWVKTHLLNDQVHILHTHHSSPPQHLPLPHARAPRLTGAWENTAMARRAAFRTELELWALTKLCRGARRETKTLRLVREPNIQLAAAAFFFFT